MTAIHRTTTWPINRGRIYLDNINDNTLIWSVIPARTLNDPHVFEGWNRVNTFLSFGAQNNATGRRNAGPLLSEQPLAWSVQVASTSEDALPSLNLPQAYTPTADHDVIPGGSLGDSIDILHFGSLMEGVSTPTSRSGLSLSSGLESQPGSQISIGLPMIPVVAPITWPQLLPGPLLSPPGSSYSQNYSLAPGHRTPQHSGSTDGDHLQPRTQITRPGRSPLGMHEFHISDTHLAVADGDDNQIDTQTNHSHVDDNYSQLGQAATLSSNEDDEDGEAERGHRVSQDSFRSLDYTSPSNIASKRRHSHSSNEDHDAASSSHQTHHSPRKRTRTIKER